MMTKSVEKIVEMEQRAVFGYVEPRKLFGPSPLINFRKYFDPPLIKPLGSRLFYRVQCEGLKGFWPF